jgi:hypothetical protein
MAHRTADTYIDANGNKVVEPIFNGTGGTAGGIIGIKK